MVWAFKGFDEHKNFAAGQASHDWVLSIDAGEVVSIRLRVALRARPQAKDA
jgi:hypothetical protein